MAKGDNNWHHLAQGKKCVIYRLDIIFSITNVSKITCSVRDIFVDIGRGISEERYQTSCHVKSLKNGNGCLLLRDTWLTYLKKLQRSQDVSKEILSDLVGKNTAEFIVFPFSLRSSGNKGALNNYSVLKLRFFNQHPHFCNVL